MSIEAMKQALEALEKLWDIIDDIDTYGDMAKSDDKLYRSLVAVSYTHLTLPTKA